MYMTVRRRDAPATRGNGKDYLALYPTHPIAAQELLQNFSDKLLEDVLQVSRDLLNDLFTRLTIDVQAEYRFAGA